MICCCLLCSKKFRTKRACASWQRVMNGWPHVKLKHSMTWSKDSNSSTVYVHWCRHRAWANCRQTFCWWATRVTGKHVPNKISHHTLMCCSKIHRLTILYLRNAFHSLTLLVCFTVMHSAAVWPWPFCVCQKDWTTRIWTSAWMHSVRIWAAWPPAVR